MIRSLVAVDFGQRVPALHGFGLATASLAGLIRSLFAVDFGQPVPALHGFGLATASLAGVTGSITQHQRDVTPPS